MKNNNDKLVAVVNRRKKPSSLGPGVIIAAMVVGPGSITVCSKLGATMGYSILWAITLAGLMMINFIRIGGLIGMVSRDSFLSIASRKYGSITALLIGMCGFLIAIGFQTGNNIGVGLALESMLGGRTELWEILFTSIALFFLWSSRNAYDLLEKLMTFLVAIMVISFVGNLFLIKPEGMKIVRGFIPSSPSELSLLTAAFATTFSVAAAGFQIYLVKSKGWSIDDYNRTMRDSALGVGVMSLICIVIVITSAAVLMPLGIKVESALDMARQLEPLLGSLAKWLFLFGLWAGAFSSFIVNAMVGGTYLADGLGLGSTLNSRWAKILASAVMLCGNIIAIVFGENPIELLVLAQGITILGVPLIAIVMLGIGNDRKIMGNYRCGAITNFVGIASILWLIYLSLNRLIDFI